MVIMQFITRPAAIVINHITGFARSSVFPSVSLFRAGF